MEAVEEVKPFGASEREAFYATADPIQEPEEQAVPEAETVTQEEYKSEPPVEESAKEEVKEEKTVPYGALKEEREKRKTLQKEKEELQDRLSKVLEDFQNHVRVKDDVQPEVIEDYDKEIIELKKENKRLFDEMTALKGTFQTEQKQKAQTELQQRINTVDADLLKEGYPGFTQFIDHVTRELSVIAADDRDEAMKLDNPEGWKKIYKEKVFNNLSSIFTKKEAEDKKTSKLDAKKDAQGVVLTPGKLPQSRENSEEESYDDYAASRRKGFVRS